jgi:hypothetical protein
MKPFIRWIIRTAFCKFACLESNINLRNFHFFNCIIITLVGLGRQGSPSYICPLIRFSPRNRFLEFFYAGDILLFHLRFVMSLHVNHSLPHSSSSQAKPEDTLDLSRLINDDIAATVRSHPTRFVVTSQ